MAGTSLRKSLKTPRWETLGAVDLLVVVAPYYASIADDLLCGAKTALIEANATYDILEVPGALEIPIAIGLASRTGKYHGYVALGCVVRGETSHYDIVSNESARGLIQLGLSGHCIGNGILTVDRLEQAELRADPDGLNKGGDAAVAALHLISLSERLSLFGNRF